MMLQAFHNDPAIKKKFLARVTQHEKADRIIKGKYWENGKGCAVGCTIEGVKTEGSFRQTYEAQLGLPRWLAALEDRIFEGLPNGHALSFPRRFLASIRPGADLTLVKPKFLYWILGNLPKLDKKYSNCTKAVRGVMKLMKKASEGKAVKIEDWREARNAANAAYAAAARGKFYIAMSRKLLELLRAA